MIVAFMFQVGSPPARATPVAQTTNSRAASNDFMFPSKSMDPKLGRPNR